MSSLGNESLGKLLTGADLNPAGIALPGNCTANTPAQFDNDTSVATTAFVQRALGNMSSAKIVGATGGILAEDAGKFIEVFGTSGNITLTLPDISTVPSGTTFEFYNNSGFGCAIQRSGSAIIANGSGVAQTSYTLSVQSTARLISDGYNWFLTGGAGYFQLNASGFQRLTSGLIIQWGSVLTNGSGDATWTYPIAFPNAVVSAVSQLFQVLSTATATVQGTPSKTSFSVKSSAISLNVFVLAIGY